MTPQFKAELLKICSTRTTAGLVLGMVAVVGLITLLTGLIANVPELRTTEDQRELLSDGSLAGLFSALAGIMLVTSEYRYGTIRPTLLFTPKRPRVLSAKLAAGALAGLLFGIVGGALAFTIGWVCLTGRGIDSALSGGQTALVLLGTVAGCAAWGAIGVAVGAILRTQVGAVIGLLAWGVVVENILFGLVPGVGRFGPLHPGDGLLGQTTAHLLDAAPGGLVLAASAALLVPAGIALVVRRDVD